MTSDNKLAPDPLTNGGAVSSAALIAIVVLTLSTIVAAVTMSYLMPEQQGNLGLMLAFASPIIGGMLTLVIGQRQLHKDVNSRLSEMVAATATAAKAQGHVDERAGVSLPTTPEIKAAEVKAAEIKP